MAELIAGDTPVLWLDFSSWQGATHEAVLEKLASESWGLPHRSGATDLEGTLGTLVGFCAETNIPTIALTGAEFVPQLTDQLLARVGTQLRVIISGTEILVRTLKNRYPDSLLISREDLQITLAEARDESFGSTPDSGARCARASHRRRLRDHAAGNQPRTP